MRCDVRDTIWYLCWNTVYENITLFQRNVYNLVFEYSKIVLMLLLWFGLQDKRMVNIAKEHLCCHSLAEIFGIEWSFSHQ